MFWDTIIFCYSTAFAQFFRQSKREAKRSPFVCLMIYCTSWTQNHSSPVLFPLWARFILRNAYQLHLPCSTSLGLEHTADSVYAAANQHWISSHFAVITIFITNQRFPWFIDCTSDSSLSLKLKAADPHFRKKGIFKFCSDTMLENCCERIAYVTARWQAALDPTAHTNGNQISCGKIKDIWEVYM